MAIMSRLSDRLFPTVLETMSDEFQTAAVLCNERTTFFDSRGAPVSISASISGAIFTNGRYYRAYRTPRRNQFGLL
jgi:hypothetical protein